MISNSKSLVVTYSNQKPPIYDRCRQKFGPRADWDRGTIFTYGDTVHCKYEIPDHIKVHEQVHVRQQLAMGKDKWWDRYFEDPKFRLTQEIEAYKAQIEFARETMNREARRSLKEKILDDMVHTYGGMCTKAEAEAHLYGN